MNTMISPMSRLMVKRFVQITNIQLLEKILTSALTILRVLIRCSPAYMFSTNVSLAVLAGVAVVCKSTFNASMVVLAGVAVMGKSTFNASMVVLAGVAVVGKSTF